MEHHKYLELEGCLDLIDLDVSVVVQSAESSVKSTVSSPSLSPIPLFTSTFNNDDLLDVNSKGDKSKLFNDDDSEDVNEAIQPSIPHQGLQSKTLDIASPRNDFRLEAEQVGLDQDKMKMYFDARNKYEDENSIGSDDLCKSLDGGNGGDVSDEFEDFDEVEVVEEVLILDEVLQAMEIQKTDNLEIEVEMSVIENNDTSRFDLEMDNLQDLQQQPTTPLFTAPVDFDAVIRLGEFETEQSLNSATSTSTLFMESDVSETEKISLKLTLNESLDILSSDSLVDVDYVINLGEKDTLSTPSYAQRVAQGVLAIEDLSGIEKLM